LSSTPFCHHVPCRYAISTLSLHDALPISNPVAAAALQTAQRQMAQLKAAPSQLTVQTRESNPGYAVYRSNSARIDLVANVFPVRSEEHTSELQSRFDLVCRLLLEKINE